jgi:hypothetical protein
MSLHVVTTAKNPWNFTDISQPLRKTIKANAFFDLIMATSSVCDTEEEE